MTTIRTAIQILGTIPFLVVSLMAQTWVLPHNLPVKDSGQRTYRFVVDYNTANTRGEIVRPSASHWRIHSRTSRRRRHVEKRNGCCRK
jgi:hypothetical protein